MLRLQEVCRAGTLLKIRLAQCIGIPPADSYNVCSGVNKAKPRQVTQPLSILLARLSGGPPQQPVSINA
jgi:hypothetical protein